MADKLIIVESPAKVKTIKKFLGSGYDVEASGGHVRDLPKSRMGIDPENNYEPKYITIRGKGDVLASLRRKAKKAKKVYLATDPDREGEAIAWHLREALGLDDSGICRISFNEITKNAVRDALKSPRDINMNLVNAQQARRILDRVVGYGISPVLWKKVKRGLSAGRVQSAALSMICAREEVINAFEPEEYWTLDATLLAEGEKHPVVVRYNDKPPLRTGKDADALIEECGRHKFVVSDIKRMSRTRKAPMPFTTSTLQQEAVRRLNFSTQKTMRVAQQLYEGVDIKGSGTTGLITYLRTDSVRVSAEAESAAAGYIKDTYGDEYYVRRSAPQGKGNVQDAHEAIRPTDISRTPASVKMSLSAEQFKVYRLIWERFAASRMADAKYDSMTVKVKAHDAVFAVSVNVQTFDGYRAVYDDGDGKLEKKNPLEKITKDTKLSLVGFDPRQHFTQPPAHYTEATLVRAMEECGIGRPSTYAPTIITLLARHYITKEGKNLFVTELGEVVNNIMQTSFPQIVDEGFTADFEKKLDLVADGETAWQKVVGDFYPGLKKDIEKAEDELAHVTVADEVTDVVCELCGRNMVIKYGPHGKFLACPGFPECRNTKPYLVRTGIVCPKCGGEVVIRRTRKGRKYYGCEHNPECDFMSWKKPAEETKV